MGYSNLHLGRGPLGDDSFVGVGTPCGKTSSWVDSGRPKDSMSLTLYYLQTTTFGDTNLITKVFHYLGIMSDGRSLRRGREDGGKGGEGGLRDVSVTDGKSGRGTGLSEDGT